MHFIPSTNHELLDDTTPQLQIPVPALNGGMELDRMFVRIPRFDRSMIPGLALGGVWFAGVSLGLWAARFYGESVTALSLAAGGMPVSFLSACLVTMLPLFLSAFAVFFFHRAGAILACAVRGLSIGFLLGCFGLAGGFWLGALLLFSGLSGSSVLLWFLWRRLSLGMNDFRRDALWAAAVVTVIAAVDFWVVSPFLERALSF